MKAISRSPIVIREIVGLGEDLRRGVRNIKEVVTFDEEELTEEILQARVRSTVGRIDVILKHQKKIHALEEKLAAPHAEETPRQEPRKRARHVGSSAAEHVYINRIVRELKYTNGEKKRLLDKDSTRLSTPCVLLSARSRLSRPRVQRPQESPEGACLGRSTSASRRTTVPTSSAWKPMPASRSPS